jgi:SnoaL-like protein
MTTCSHSKCPRIGLGARLLAACLIVAFNTVFIIATALVLAAPPARQSEPGSVLQNLFAARNSVDSDRALALFADDGVIINVVGARFVGRDNIKTFLQSADVQRDRYEIEDVRVAGGIVTWIGAVSNEVYEKLGVAPVQVAEEALIRDGKIQQLVSRFSAGSLAKFERACEQEGCETPKADGVLFFGQPCLKFIGNAWAQTRSATEH